MITANEARQLVLNSNQHLQKYFPIIDARIKNAANEGKSKVALYVDDLWAAEDYYAPTKPTSLQIRIIKELELIGYHAEFTCHGAQYVPLGMQDNDGNGPKFINHVIMVTWG